MRAPKDQSIRETKYNNKTKMKKSQLRKIIREAINSMGIEPLGYYTDQGEKTEENPEDIEHWLNQIEGMSLDAATRHLGLKGLPSSMTDKILQHHNTDIVDTFDEFSDEENPFPSSRKSIDQLDKDDLYEISPEMKAKQQKYIDAAAGKSSKPKKTQFRKDIEGAKRMMDAGSASDEQIISKYGEAAFNAVNAENEYMEENLNEGIGPLEGVMLLGLTAAVLGGVAANVGGSLDSLTKYIHTGGPGKAAANLKQASISSWGSFLRKLPFIGSKLRKQDEENRLKAEIGAALQEFIKTGEGVEFIKSLMEDPEGKDILTRVSNGSSNYTRLYDIIRKYLNIMMDDQGGSGNREWQRVKKKFFALRKDIKGGEYKDTITPPDSDDGMEESLNENTMRKSQLKELVKEAYLEYLREEDDEDIEDEIEDDFEAEPAVAQDGESKNQESAPRKRINFENRELEMLVDVNKNATKKGIKIQFLSDDELSKEERTKLVSSLQTYLDEGLAKFVKGAKLNIDSDPDVPNKTKTVGFTIKIGDIFGLVSKVFSNRGDDEEGGEEVEADETEELQELRQRIREELINESAVNEAAKEVVLSNEILDFLEERGIVKGSDAQKVHKDLTAFLKEKLI
jgi:hypothetical protein